MFPVAVTISILFIIMALYLSGFEDSDDEVFVGPVTMDEIKKRFIPPKHRRTVGYTTATSIQECDESVRIIQTHSAPNLNTQSVTIPKISISLSASNIIENILDIQHDNSSNKTSIHYTTEVPDLDSLNIGESHNEIAIYKSKGESEHEIRQEMRGECSTYEQKTNAYHSGYLTPMKEKPNNDNSTPEMKLHTPVFKTPGIPVSMKKHATPSKKAFQHVVSPISVYIKQSPVTPLIRNVKPKKPLPGPSAIPKPVRSTKANLTNKENVKLPSVAYKTAKETKMENFKLPSVAYKTAKETKMIDIPDHDKLPESQWAKQITSSIPRAMVIKHEHREGNSAKKQVTRRRDDSLANLSLHQADLSVCTQKSAYKPMT